MTKPQINVTPLIDVLLVLLIIFMVVTPMKPSAFEAKIPKEPDTDRRVESPPLALVVVVSAAGMLRLNNEKLGTTVEDPKALVDRLTSIFEERTRNLVLAENAANDPAGRIEKTVFIKAPRGIGYGSVAKVVDAVKIAGAYPVSLQIDDLE